MTHSDIEARMADYLEGDLPLAKRALFDAHLDACEDCARELSDMRATIGALKSLPVPEVPPDFADNVMRRIRAGEAEPNWLDRVAGWFVGPAIPRIAIPVTAMATAAGVLVLTGQLEIQIQPAGTLAAVQTPSVKRENVRTRAPSLANQAVPSTAADAAPVPPMRLAHAAEAGAASPATSALGSGSRPGSSGRLDRPTRQPRERWQTQRVAVVPIPDVGRAERTANPFETGRRELPHQQLVLGATPYGVVQVADMGGLGTSRSRTLGWQRSLNPVSSPRPNAITQPHRVLDARLRYLEHNPQAFARKQAQLSLAAQELWTKKLAERAATLGSLDEVLALLQGTGDPAAASLADALATSAAAGEGAPAADAIQISSGTDELLH